MKKGKEQKLLEALRTQEPWGLEAAINRYAPYVAGSSSGCWETWAPKRTWRS